LNWNDPLKFLNICIFEWSKKQNKNSSKTILFVKIMESKKKKNSYDLFFKNLQKYFYNFQKSYFCVKRMFEDEKWIKIKRKL
jgi:hypothetical protein